MIRLLRRVGSLPAGTETAQFDAAAEAAFVLDGTAERIADEVTADDDSAAPDYEGESKDDLIRLAMSRGVDVKPRAAKREIIEALQKADES